MQGSVPCNHKPVTTFLLCEVMPGLLLSQVEVGKALLEGCAHQVAALQQKVRSTPCVRHTVDTQ